MRWRQRVNSRYSGTCVMVRLKLPDSGNDCYPEDIDADKFRLLYAVQMNED